MISKFGVITLILLLFIIIVLIYTVREEIIRRKKIKKPVIAEIKPENKKIYVIRGGNEKSKK